MGMEDREPNDSNAWEVKCMQLINSEEAYIKRMIILFKQTVYLEISISFRFIITLAVFVTSP